MLAPFERLKKIGMSTKDLVNGYIRRCQNELFYELSVNNPYYNIPQLINNNCILFYELFTWYRKHVGKGLTFSSDTEVTVDKTHHYMWRTCAFQNMISNKFCSKFSITFKINSFSEDNKYRTGFYIGYTKEETLKGSIKNWNQQLGEKCNCETTSSWCLFNSDLYHSGEGDCFAFVKAMRYSLGDLLKMTFDFDEMKVKLYHNDIEQDCRDLLVPKIWIGLSFIHHGERVEMIKYKYD